MSVTFKTKAPPKPVLKTSSKPKVATEVEALVDKIVEQNPAVLASKEPKKIQEDARKELLALIEPGEEAKAEIVVKGTKGQVRFSPCADKRYCVDPQAVHKLLGDEAFYAMITVSLADLDKYLTAADKAKVVALGVGSRSMTVLPLGE